MFIFLNFIADKNSSHGTNWMNKFLWSPFCTFLCFLLIFEQKYCYMFWWLNYWLDQITKSVACDKLGSTSFPLGTGDGLRDLHFDALFATLACLLYALCLRNKEHCYCYCYCYVIVIVIVILNTIIEQFIPTMSRTKLAKAV